MGGQEAPARSPLRGAGEPRALRGSVGADLGHSGAVERMMPDLGLAGIPPGSINLLATVPCRMRAKTQNGPLSRCRPGSRPSKAEDDRLRPYGLSTGLGPPPAHSRWTPRALFRARRAGHQPSSGAGERPQLAIGNCPKQRSHLPHPPSACARPSRIPTSPSEDHLPSHIESQPYPDLGPGVLGERVGHAACGIPGQHWPAPHF